MADIIEQLIRKVDQGFARLSSRITRINNTEAWPAAQSWQALTLAKIPAATVGAGKGLHYFCTNCRKVGEGVGAGTGTDVYNDGTGNWKRERDDSVAAI